MAALYIVFVSSYSFSQQSISFSVQTISGSNTITCSNPVVHIIASSNHSTTVNYMWVGYSASFSGPNAFITIPGTYTITAIAANNHSSVKLITIGIDTIAPSSYISPTLQTVSCHSNSVPVVNTSYNLGINGTHNFMAPFGGTFSVNSPLAQYKPSGPGTYTYVLIDEQNGCETIKTFTVISLSGFPTLDVKSPENFTLGCGTKSIAAINILNGSTFPILGGPVSYTLLSQNSPTYIPAGALSSVTNYTVNTPGLWTVVIKDDISNCETRVPITVIQNTVGPNLAVIVPTQMLSCNFPVVQLQATSTTANTSYTWSLPSSSNNLVGNVITVPSNQANPTNSVVGNYILTGKDDNSTCSSTSVIPIYQNIYPPNAFITSGGLNLLTCLTPTIVVFHQSTSSIPSSTLFSNTLPVKVSLWKGPLPQLPSIFSSTYIAYTSGIYTATILDENNGCLSKATLPIFDGKLRPVVNTPNGPAPFCINPENPTVPIYAIVSGNGNNYIYHWTGPSNGIANGITSPTANASALGIYSVVVTNTTSGCSTLGQVIVAECYTDINENNFAGGSISIYPNPGNGLYTLESNGKEGDKRIEVYNSIGVLVKTQILYEEKEIVNLNDYPDGVYLFYVVSKKSSTHVSKIIKQ